MPSFLTRLTSFRSNDRTSTLNKSKLHRKNSHRNSVITGKNYDQNLPDVTSIKPVDENGKITQNNVIDEKETYVNEKAETINFWDIGNYKYVLARCDDGQKLGVELMEMISERAKVEEAYAKSLQQWHKKWTYHLRTKSDEYETSKDMWQNFANTGNQCADIHLEMCSSLINTPVVKIKEWLKKNYVKRYFTHKVTKDFERDFENAEKSWVDYMNKLKKAQKFYYDACKKTLSANDTVTASQSDPKLNQEQKDKLGEKAKKAADEEAKAKTSYEQILHEIDLYKPQHIKKMTEVFKKTQDFEQERMFFFRQTFLECHELMQTFNDERFERIFTVLANKLNSASPKNDLDWYSRHYGADTQAVWPQFEEYDS